MKTREQRDLNPGSLVLRWTARALFAAAVVTMGRLIWTRSTEAPKAAPPAPPLRKSPVTIDWSREPFQRWTSVEDRIELLYPARFDAVRGFGRFTSRDLLGGLTETDLVAFRSAEPRSVIVVATYRAPRRYSWDEWVALAKAPVPAPSSATGPPGSGSPILRRGQPPSVFAAEFGGSERRFRTGRAGGQPVLEVSAKGAVKYPARGNEQWELWRFESRLMASGERAVRITAGVHADQYAGTLPGLRRTLESFRWTP